MGSGGARWAPDLVSILLKEDVAMGLMDLSPLSRSLIGFDRMFEDALRLNPDDNYPPYNIEKMGEDAYRVTLAVAGFAPEDLTITWQPNSLVVAGKKAEQTGDGQYLHRG